MSLLVVASSDIWIFVPYFIHMAYRYTYYSCSFFNTHVNRSITWFVLQTMQDYCGSSVRYFLNLFVVENNFFHILQR